MTKNELITYWLDSAEATSFIGDSFDFRFMLTKLARKIDLDIEPHPYLISEFNDSNPIVYQILKYGERVAEACWTQQ